MWRKRGGRSGLPWGAHMWQRFYFPLIYGKIAFSHIGGVCAPHGGIWGSSHFAVCFTTMWRSILQRCGSFGSARGALRALGRDADALTFAEAWGARVPALAALPGDIVADAVGRDGGRGTLPTRPGTAQSSTNLESAIVRPGGGPSRGARAAGRAGRRGPAGGCSAAG